MKFKTWENAKQLELFAAIRVTNPRVDLHTPKLLIIQFHSTKIIIIHQVIQFLYIFEKQWKKIKPFLRLFENSWTQVVTKKCLWNNFHIRHKNFEKKWKKMLMKQFPNTTQKFFSSNFENLPQNFFFDRKSNFLRKQTFSEKKICMQNLFFCAHNVVLDTIILASFLFT